MNAAVSLHYFFRFFNSPRTLITSIAPGTYFLFGFFLSSSPLTFTTSMFPGTYFFRFFPNDRKDSCNLGTSISLSSMSITNANYPTFFQYLEFHRGCLRIVSSFVSVDRHECSEACQGHPYSQNQRNLRLSFFGPGRQLSVRLEVPSFELSQHEDISLQAIQWFDSGSLRPAFSLC